MMTSGTASSDLLDRLDRVLYAGHQSQMLPVAIDSRQPGGVVVDLDGNRYLDLASSRGANPFGRPPAAVLEAATAALADFGNEDVHHLTNPLVTTLARRLIESSPASLTRVDMALSGTEAIEIALRLMRRATGRPLVLGFHRQYHGETAAAVGLGAAGDSVGMRHMTPGFVHVPHPYRSPFVPAVDGTGDATVDYIRRHLLFHAVDPGDVAGIVVQPVTFEGVAPPAGFWAPLVELAREHGWLVCVDEVVSGLGRTGHLLASETVGVQPDLLCLGESLAAGTIPIGALLGSDAVMATFADTETGSTWSWLPAACAAAIAGLDEVQGTLAHVAEMAAVAHDALSGVQATDGVDDVRTHGALAAIEFSESGVSRSVAVEALSRGVLVVATATSVVLTPPLNLDLGDYRRGIAAVIGAAESVLSSR